ncbi:MAG: hypothetical protein JSS66_05260 [Armatimonadetes bacterium]|nr:hypothetical protein [Armatimonadota bacterium]
MALKTIDAVVLESMLNERFVEDPNGDRVVSFITVTLRDLTDDRVYTKDLDEEDLCELAGVDREFSPLELIRVAEHLRQYHTPVSIVVDDTSQFITNDMVKMVSHIEANKAKKQSANTGTPAKKPPQVAKKTDSREHQFAFDANRMNETVIKSARRRQAKSA